MTPGEPPQRPVIAVVGPHHRPLSRAVNAGDLPSGAMTYSEISTSVVPNTSPEAMSVIVV